MTSLEKYDKALAVLDADIKELLDACNQQTGFKPTCKGTGCNGCCYVQNFVTNVEVSRCLHALTPEEVEFVKAGTREWVDKVKDSKFMNIADEREFTASEFMRLNARCPFLRDGKCMVYAVRPFNCRTHFAIKPAELCASPDTQVQQFIVRLPDDWKGMNFMLEVLQISGGFVEFDMIGFHLSRFLLKENHPTACRKQAILEA